MLIDYELLLIETSQCQREAVRNIVARRAAEQGGSLFNEPAPLDHGNVIGQYERDGVRTMCSV